MNKRMKSGNLFMLNIEHQKDKFMRSRIRNFIFSQSTILILLLAFMTIMQSCDPNLQIVCTEESKPGLNIYVVDGQSGMALSDNVTVEISDGSYSETLQLQYAYYSGAPFAGAYERAGTYQIITSMPGYTSDTSSVLVQEDECHVITVERTIKLYQ